MLRLMPSSVFLTSPVDDVSGFFCLEDRYNEAVGHIDYDLHVNEPLDIYIEISN